MLLELCACVGSKGRGVGPVSAAYAGIFFLLMLFVRAVLNAWLQVHMETEKKICCFMTWIDAITTNLSSLINPCLRSGWMRRVGEQRTWLSKELSNLLASKQYHKTGVQSGETGEAEQHHSVGVCKGIEVCKGGGTWEIKGGEIA
eukprot:1148470-Pelagomonas_calceolata.AAC.10